MIKHGETCLISPSFSFYHQFLNLLSPFGSFLLCNSPAGLMKEDSLPDSGSLYVFMCVSGVETDEYNIADPLFSAMGSVMLDAVKRIPKQNIVSVCVCVCWGGDASKVFII